MKKINNIIASIVDYGLFITLIVVVIVAIIVALGPQVKIYIEKFHQTEVSDLKND